MIIMDIERLRQILSETTILLRKGDAVVSDNPKLIEAIKSGDPDALDNAGGGVADIYCMPHVNDARTELVRVDCHFIFVGVDKIKSDQYKNEIIGILKTYPQPERLAAGISYIEIGGVLGSQDMAMSLMALGEVLGLWKVISPAFFNMTGPDADRVAGCGFVMTTGFKPA